MCHTVDTVLTFAICKYLYFSNKFEQLVIRSASIKIIYTKSLILFMKIKHESEIHRRVLNFFQNIPATNYNFTDKFTNPISEAAWLRLHGQDLI